MAPTPAVLLAVAALLLAAVAGSATLAAANGTPATHAAVLLWLTVSFAASGLVAWWRRPANRFGPLMLATGCCALLTTVDWAGGELAHTVSQAVDLLPLMLIVHGFLAFPTGRVPHRPERALLAVGYTAAVGGQVGVMLLGAFEPHLFVVVSRPGLAMALHDVVLVVCAAVALAAFLVLLRRRRAGTRPLRRSLALLTDAFALGLVMIWVLLLVGVFGGPAFPAVQRVALALLGLAPVAFLIGLLQAHLARTAVGDLVVELRRGPADLRAPLARALRDPSLALVYWLPQFGTWADAEGRAVELPADPSRVTVIYDDGRPVAALLHDPAVADEPELLAAVSAAAALALESGRLHAELRANLDELRGSRTRVLEAGQRERQRLERDLHDGAQQRLVALSLHLGVLQTRLGDDPGARDLLAEARREIATSLTELRDLARGLHPAVLTAHGLAVALEQLAARAAVPVRLRVDVAGRVDEPVEIAAYYVVAESLTNVGKHAQASAATVTVTRAGDCLIIEVVDDGRGGADTEAGTGLRGLADRVEALGGRLRVWTPRGSGTRVRAELPCRS